MSEIEKRDITWARKITERLRLQATNYAEARDKVMATLIEARDGGAADLLGYASWTAYMADVFGDAPLRLERDARQELVAELAAEGMASRSIAPIVGVSQMQVVRDIQRAGETNVSPDAAPSETDRFYRTGGEPPTESERAQLAVRRKSQTMMQVDSNTGEVEDVPARHVTGMDGKSYAVPVQKKPNRRALTDVARDAGWDIRKAVERLERIREDDRYSRNKEEVAALLRGHLMYVIETCQGFLDDIDQSKED